MLRFDHPWVLVGLPLIGLVAVWVWRARRPALIFPDLRLLASLPAGRCRWIRRLRFGVGVVGATTLLLAAAGPRIPRPTPLVTEGIALMLVVDLSGSMFQPDMNWQGETITRFEAATRVLELFLEGGIGPDARVFLGRPQDSIGLVVAASYPETEVPLTLSHHTIIEQLRRVRPRSLDEGQTNLGDAIAEALARLDSATGKQRVILVLSDGEHNFPGTAESPTWSPDIAAQRAADLGVSIHTIDTGGQSLLQPEIRAQGQRNLRNLAEKTGGLYAVADDVPRLVEVCQQIDQIERQRMLNPRLREDRSVHHYFGSIAVVSLAVYGLLCSTWARWVP